MSMNVLKLTFKERYNNSILLLYKVVKVPETIIRVTVT